MNKLYAKYFEILKTPYTLLVKLYTSKLVKDFPPLWQRPCTGHVNYTDEEWFLPKDVGKDMMERFMKLSLAKSVLLDGSNTYINHSIHATNIYSGQKRF